MPEATIKIKAHSYETEVELNDGTATVVRTARRGDTVDLSDEEYERGERLGAFLAEGEEINEDGTVGEFDAVNASDDELDAWLEDEEPNVSEVVAAAQEDPESARRLLAAENRVTGNDPRKGVVTGLESIVGEDDEE